MSVRVCVCVRACVRTMCVHAYVRACVRGCVRGRVRQARTPVVTGLHDSVLVYAWAVDQVLRSGGDPADGSQITRAIWNNTIPGGGWCVVTGGQRPGGHRSVRRRLRVVGDQIDFPCAEGSELGGWCTSTTNCIYLCVEVGTFI